MKHPLLHTAVSVAYWVIIGVTVYILSIGPVVLLVYKTVGPYTEGVDEALRLIYGPIIYVTGEHGPLYELLCRYVELFTGPVPPGMK